MSLNSGMSTTRAPAGAQSAIRAVRLLKLFTPDRRELALQDICRLAGLNKTTAHRLLKALESEALIDRNPANRHYRLGTGLMALGAQAMSSNELRRRAQPVLQFLANESGETATLEVLVDDSIMIVDEVTGRHAVGASGNVGTRWPLHATSTGKAILARRAELVDGLPDPLPRLMPNTIVDKAELDRELQIIRGRGYAESIDELEAAFTGVATDLRDSYGNVLGAISVCGPTSRFEQATRVRLGNLVRHAVRRLDAVA